MRCARDESYGYRRTLKATPVPAKYRPRRSPSLLVLRHSGNLRRLPRRSPSLLMIHHSGNVSLRLPIRHASSRAWQSCARLSQTMRPRPCLGKQMAVASQALRCGLQNICREGCNTPTRPCSFLCSTYSKLTNLVRMAQSTYTCTSVHLYICQPPRIGFVPPSVAAVLLAHAQGKFGCLRQRR